MRICSTKQIVNFATTVEGPTTQEISECIENIDNIHDNTISFPTNMTEVSNTVVKLKNNKQVGIDGVSAEVLKTSLLVIILILIQFLKLSSSRGWFPKCVKDAKVCTLQKSFDILNISNFRLISILPTISKVFKIIIHEGFCSFFDKKILLYPKQFSFCSKRSTIDALA